jgi:hypothetical protein
MTNQTTPLRRPRCTAKYARHSRSHAIPDLRSVKTTRSRALHGLKSRGSTSAVSLIAAPHPGAVRRLVGELCRRQRME